MKRTVYVSKDPSREDLLARTNLKHVGESEVGVYELVEVISLSGRLQARGIMPNSLKGKLIARNFEDFPKLSLDEHIPEAQRLLNEASGRKIYALYSLKYDRSHAQSLQKLTDARLRRVRNASTGHS